MSSVSKPSILHKVDLHPRLNNTFHHTLEVSDEQLVLRRGQEFIVTFHLNLPFNVEDFLPLTFTASTGEHPSENQGTLSYFSIPDGVARSPEAKALWKVKFQQEPHPLSNTVVLSLTPPADAPIGEYAVTLNMKNEDVSLSSLVLLFNPWCHDDSVFLSDEAQRQEYVMNEQGVIYVGSGNYISSVPWDYGQFEEDMVAICMKMLNVSHLHQRHPAQDVASRCNPIYVSRLISAMINSEDDCGVLEGRWGGSYADGVRPTHWTGSHQILKQWLNINCRAVKYAQCWVFAGVMCSVMRLLGIPSRVVTNFNSAHDTNKNLVIDVYHTDVGVSEIPSYDSIWNFHVWVESWMTRPDLAEDGTFDGWQVVDSTPQEPSDGVYCCGPASVNSVLNGNTDHSYDVPFVFAEVNADCIDWMIKVDGSAVRMHTDSKRVGQSISTKSVGSKKRSVITDYYKHPEGSVLERSVFHYAITRDFSLESDEEDEYEPPEELENTGSDEAGEEAETEEGVDNHRPNEDVTIDSTIPQLSMRFHEVSKPVNGQDFKVNLIIHSKATSSVSLTVTIKVCAMLYNGKPGDIIVSEVKDETLLPTKELSIPIVVNFSDYWKPMLEYDNMKISAIVSDKNNPNDTFLAESDVVLKDPPLKVMFSSLLLNHDGYVDVLFDNPVNKTLTQCTLTLSGSGLLKDTSEVQLPDLRPNMRLRVRFPFIPYKAGEKTLVVEFDCSMFRDIKTSRTVVVKS